MPSTTQHLRTRGLVNSAPAWLGENVMYETIMGSHAYGVADTSVTDKVPDYDVYGFAIPPKDFVFPHLAGHIAGFGSSPSRFDQFQQHHIMEVDGNGGRGKEWDLNIFNIVKFFELCRQNNPNMIDSLFTRDNCVLHCTRVGQMVRDNRRWFLSKLAWKKFRGYAHAQLKKMGSKDRQGARQEIVDKYGYDVKFAYHIVRLLDEAEQILLEGDLDLQRAREPMKAIRRGDWKIEEVRDWAIQKEIALEAAYVNCALPDRPDERVLRQLLIDCLEEHYGSLDDCVSNIGWAEETLRNIDNMIGLQRARLYRN